MPSHQESLTREKQVLALIDIFKPVSIASDSYPKMQMKLLSAAENVRDFGLEDARQLLGSLIESFTSGEKMSDEERSLLYYVDLTAEYIPGLGDLHAFIEQKYRECVEAQYGSELDSLIAKYDLNQEMRVQLLPQMLEAIRLGLNLEERRQTKEEILLYFDTVLNRYRKRTMGSK